MRMGCVSMETVGRILIGGILLLALEASAMPPADTVSPGSQIGQSLYRDGSRASGEPLRATVQKGVVLKGADAACVKRSLSVFRNGSRSSDIPTNLIGSSQPETTGFT
jgi:hypothetical protein